MHSPSYNAAIPTSSYYSEARERTHANLSFALCSEAKRQTTLDETQGEYVFQGRNQYFRFEEDPYPGDVNNGGQGKAVFARGSHDADQKETRNIHGLPMASNLLVITISW